MSLFHGESNRNDSHMKKFGANFGGWEAVQKENRRRYVTLIKISWRIVIYKLVPFCYGLPFFSSFFRKKEKSCSRLIAFFVKKNTDGQWNIIFQLNGSSRTYFMHKPNCIKRESKYPSYR